jgi:hypothetical protein
MRKLMLTTWMLVAGTCLAQQVDLKALDQFALKTNNKTEISLDETMLQAAAGFLNSNQSEEAAVKAASKNIKAIFVRSYEFEQEGAYKLDDLKPLFDQLKAPDWSRFLQSQEDSEQTEIWMHKTNGVGDGILLISAEEEELTVVNIVGSANLADLAVLGNLANPSGFTIRQSAPPQPPPAAKDE